MKLVKAGCCHLQTNNEQAGCVTVCLPDCNCLFCTIINSVVGEVILPLLHVALLPCPRVMIKPGKFRILTGQ